MEEESLQRACSKRMNKEAIRIGQNVTVLNSPAGEKLPPSGTRGRISGHTPGWDMDWIYTVRWNNGSRSLVNRRDFTNGLLALASTGGVMKKTAGTVHMFAGDPYHQECLPIGEVAEEIFEADPIDPPRCEGCGEPIACGATLARLFEDDIPDPEDPDQPYEIEQKMRKERERDRRLVTQASQDPFGLLKTAQDVPERPDYKVRLDLKRKPPGVVVPDKVTEVTTEVAKLLEGVNSIHESYSKVQEEINAAKQALLVTLDPKEKYAREHLRLIDEEMSKVAKIISGGAEGDTFARWNESLVHIANNVENISMAPGSQQKLDKILKFLMDSHPKIYSEVMPVMEQFEKDATEIHQNIVKKIEVFPSTRKGLPSAKVLESSKKLADAMSDVFGTIKSFFTGLFERVKSVFSSIRAVNMNLAEAESLSSSLNTTAGKKTAEEEIPNPLEPGVRVIDDLGRWGVIEDMEDILVTTEDPPETLCHVRLDTGEIDRINADSLMTEEEELDRAAREEFGKPEGEIPNP